MEINIFDDLGKRYMREKGVNKFCLGVKVESLLSLYLDMSEEIDKLAILNNKLENNKEKLRKKINKIVFSNMICEILGDELE